MLWRCILIEILVLKKWRISTSLIVIMYVETYWIVVNDGYDENDVEEDPENKYFG